MGFYQKIFIFILILAMSIQGCSSKIVGGYATQNPISPEIISTSTGLIGTTESNPAPVGVGMIADNMQFHVTGAIRPADGIVSAGNIFNKQPGEWQQYIFATLEIACERPTGQNCHLSIFKLVLLGSDGVINYPERLILGVPGLLENSDFSSGATISGNVPFIISIGDSHLLLVYDSTSDASYYFALP